MLVRTLIAAAALIALTGCDNRELGAVINDGTFGNATMNNTLLQSGAISATQTLQARFAKEVPSTINFAFNSSALDDASRAVLAQQANWIRQFPELRFRVYGHTDLVGSAGFNQALGKRRAEAVVAFFGSQGISRSRLEALVSYGKTRPVVQTTAPELRNRRTVTEVSGFVKNHPTPLNGKYAEVIWREYIEGATREHPRIEVQESQTNPGQGN